MTTTEDVLNKYKPKRSKQMAEETTTNGGNGADPAPSQTELHHERMAQLVANISLVALDELRGMRDQVDGLMIAMHQRKDTVLQVVQEYTQMSQAVVDTKQIIGDALVRLQAQFNDNRIAPTLRGSAKVALPPAPTIEDDIAHE